MYVTPTIKEWKGKDSLTLNLNPPPAVSQHLICSQMLKVQLSGFESIDKLQGGGVGISRLLLWPNSS